MLTEVDCNYEALRASAELKHSLFLVIFTAIFVPNNKIHRKYVHLFRPKNKRPKNKKMPFSAPKTKNKTKFGRPLVVVAVVVVVVVVVVVDTATAPGKLI